MQWIVDTTLPNKLNLMEDLVEKISEMMIDEDFVLSEIQNWTLETRKVIEETCRIGQKRESQWLMHTMNRKR